jgi:hypothetical protein
MASNEKCSTLKTRGIQKTEPTESLCITRKDRLAVTITKIDLITHMIVKTTRINAPAMIAADHLHEIAPTPRCAARAALAITTKMEHRSMMTRRNTINK